MSAGDDAVLDVAVLDVAELDRLPEFRALVDVAHGGGAIAAGGLWGASQAFVVAGLARRAQGPWLVLVSSDAEADSFAADLRTFGVDSTVMPAREHSDRRSRPDVEAVRQRLRVAQMLAGPPERRPRVLVASLLSMIQPLPEPDALASDFLNLQTGQRLDTEDLLERLVATGYARQPLAEAPGEVSLRGDILDVFPFAAELPLRIELFDDEIESLRTFDPADQRSVESQKRVSVCIAADAGGVEDGTGAAPSTLLAPTTVHVRIEPLRIEDQAQGLSLRSTSHKRALAQLEDVARGRTRIALQSLPAARPASGTGFETRSIQSLSVGVPRAPAALRELVEDGTRALVLCRTDAEQHRFREILTEHGVEHDAASARIATRVGMLSKGFRVPALELVLVTHAELAGVERARRVAPKRTHHRVKALQSFFELRPGDLVVHAVHGVALFQALELMPRGAGEEEHLHLLFADDVSLFVPASRIDLVQRYVGSGAKAPGLDKLGSTSFRRRKEKVERALYDLAADLLEVQAKRELNRRPAWPPDDHLVVDMVRSFPYEDTPDQATADREITSDLNGPKPLDRLLCGDVGFGKTEVAVRAAFRVANGGGQVAVLVPTTVLAEQHARTFRARLADYPVEVATLTRTKTGKEERETITAIAEGKIDIAIGTHRLLSKDVSFQRLGLVVIDEEQRFGVRHKEHFKRMRANVDVLTMTATPIPRTLHMSLAGVRDISALSVAPPGRQNVETLIAYRDDDLLLREVLLRERNRGGQVFFLHNRVHSIEQVATRLRALVPEMTFLVGHGQMPAKQLSEVMDVFTRGDVDCLVSTSIVENGIDVPSAGTILIDRADLFGLSELHQLRGRVGRGAQKAHCFLLVEEHQPLPKHARERLEALAEMSHLGAGFDISMKDLELRGAGNILGPEQSGHISAIGYDMYCQLLKQTVERIKAGATLADLAEPEAPHGPIDPGTVELELGLSAHLPRAWIASSQTRLEILRRLDAIRSDADAADAAAELRDRYGRLPEQAQTLVRVFRLRARLAALGIGRASWRDDAYLVQYNDRVLLQGAFGGAAEIRAVREGHALVVVPVEARSPENALAWLERVLKVGDADKKMSPARRSR